MFASRGISHLGQSHGDDFDGKEAAPKRGFAVAGSFANSTGPRAHELKFSRVAEASQGLSQGYC